MLLGSGDVAWASDDDVATGAREPAMCHSSDMGESLGTGVRRMTPTRARHEDHASTRTYAPTADAGATDLATAYAYCKYITRAIARTFYYGSRFLPLEKRRATWALYAFCRTADDVADEPVLYPEPLAELEMWRAALVDVYAGTPRGPIMTAWADMLERFAVPLDPALDLLTGVEMDVRGRRYETFDDLRLYCYRVAGTVGLLMSPILGYDDPAALTAAVDLGIAMQLTNILRDVGEDLVNGRFYLPTEDMVRFGYSEDELRAGVVNGAFVKLIEHQIVRAEQYYERGMRGVALLRPESRLAIALSGRLYAAILNRIRDNGYDVFSRRAHISLAGKIAMLPGVWLNLAGNR